MSAPEQTAGRPGDEASWAVGHERRPASSSDLEGNLQAAIARGESVALATVVTGAGSGRRLLVWSAGQVFGDLGWPRLNQRVALFAEQVIPSGPTTTEKPFDRPGGEVVVRVEVHRPARSGG